MASRDAQRRIISVVQRVESEPRTYTPPRRTPRLSGDSVSVLYCVPSGAISGTSGPPSGTVHSLSGQSVYSLDSGAWSLVTSSAVVYNPYGAGVASAKICSVVPDNGGYRVVAQSCT